MALQDHLPASAGGEKEPGGTASDTAGSRSHRFGTTSPGLQLWGRGKETFLSRRTVYRFEDSFYRVDELLFREKPFLVMECASREEEVQNNTMEDADPFPWDLGEEEILAELRELLEVDR